MKATKRRGRGRGWQVSVLLGLLLLLYHMVGVVPASAKDPAASPPPRGSAVLQAATLSGPDGTIGLANGQPLIVHVWLQGCGDCMPAFEAMRRLHEGGNVMPLPVINVAYGRASKQWAQRYGLHDPLVFDAGENVVRPLGIGTFTTLVVDGDGTVLERVRPTQSSYIKRILAAARKTQPGRQVDCGVGGIAAQQSSTSAVPWTLIAPLALLVVGVGWRLFPATLARGPRLPAFVSTNRVGLTLQAGQRCPYCHGGISKREDLTTCGECRTIYHLACAREASSCTTLVCVNFHVFAA